ncbi:hypothetical protein ACFSBI_15920, partial [Amnibacterium endophyticum]
RVQPPTASPPRAQAAPARAAARSAVSEPQPPAGWGAVPPPTDADAPDDEPEPEPAPPAQVHRPVPPMRPDEEHRYGEAVVREILQASFLEETTVAPTEVR